MDNPETLATLGTQNTWWKTKTITQKIKSWEIRIPQKKIKETNTNGVNSYAREG